MQLCPEIIQIFLSFNALLIRSKACQLIRCFVNERKDSLLGQAGAGRGTRDELSRIHTRKLMARGKKVKP